MADRKWSYLINTFEVNTRGSHVKGVALSTDHKAKLESVGLTDAEVALWHTEFIPIWQSYIDIDQNYKLITGERKGKTQSVETLFKDLNDHLKIWEGKVHAEFPEDSDTEVEIFPNKRQPFQTGTYENRIQTIATLANKLGQYPGQAATKVLVQSFYNNILAAREAEQNKEGSQTNLSALREQQRILVMEAMYGDLGRAMFKYRTNPDLIEALFDVAALRSTSNGAVTLPGSAPAGISNIDYGTTEINDDTPVTLKNLSAIDLVFFFSDAPGNDATGPTVPVVAGAEVSVTAGELNFDDVNRSLNVKNASVSAADFEVVIG